MQLTPETSSRHLGLARSHGPSSTEITTGDAILTDWDRVGPTKAHAALLPGSVQQQTYEPT